MSASDVMDIGPEPEEQPTSSYTLRGTTPYLWKAAKSKAGSASQLVAVIERLLKGWLGE